jgi:hypothetical protein
MARSLLVVATVRVVAGVDPVYRPQVEDLARRSGVDSPDSPTPFEPVGRVPTSDAARILGISKQQIPRSRRQSCSPL